MSVPLAMLRRVADPGPALAGAATAAVVVVVAAGAIWAAAVVDGSALADAARAAVGAPAEVALALGAFALAFALRAAAWRRVVPALPLGQALAGIHLATGANHVLPFRLGEPLRVVSVLRRTAVPPAPVVGSTVLLRTADIASLVTLGVLVAPGALAGVLGPLGWLVLAVVLGVGVAALVWVRRRAVRQPALLRRPDGLVLALTVAAWALEAVTVHTAAGWAGVELDAAEAVLVTAFAVSAQLVAIGPGGFGTYEAAAVAAMAVAGVAAGPALAAALVIHATKTAYTVAAGALALFWPRPSLLGRWRLPRRLPGRRPEAVGPGPVVLLLPAHDEEPRIADVVRRAPGTVAGRPVVVLVVDDGSGDATAAQAAEAGAVVVAHEANRGLGAAVRTGLAHAVAALDAAVVAFCDADGEYAPEELGHVVAPILDGEADYVVGSRFAGRIDSMRPHRRFGNQVLTFWVRVTARRPVSDGQSGYRALSRAAAAEAEIVHDYNYAQVLTLDLLAKGFRYAEVPISYRFRTSGRSFVRLGRYLRAVVPAVWHVLNRPEPTVGAAPLPPGPHASGSSGGPSGGVGGGGDGGDGPVAAELRA